MVVAFGPTPGASAAPKPFGGNDHPTQTTGTAVRYGTSAPLPRIAAASPTHAATARDSGVAHHVFPRSAMNKARRRCSRRRRRVPRASNPGAATGFNGLSHLDQRNAGTGIYANTNPSMEPPDQGLCVGNGFVVEPINVALAVYNENGNS